MLPDRSGVAAPEPAGVRPLHAAPRALELDAPEQSTLDPHSIVVLCGRARSQATAAGPRTPTTFASTQTAAAAARVPTITSADCSAARPGSAASTSSEHGPLMVSPVQRRRRTADMLDHSASSLRLTCTCGGVTLSRSGTNPPVRCAFCEAPLPTRMDRLPIQRVRAGPSPLNLP